MKGVDIRSVQEALGHSSIRTTQVYLHVIRALQGKIGSPLDDLPSADLATSQGSADDLLASQLRRNRAVDSRQRGAG